MPSTPSTKTTKSTRSKAGAKKSTTAKTTKAANGRGAKSASSAKSVSAPGKSLISPALQRVLPYGLVLAFVISSSWAVRNYVGTLPQYSSVPNTVSRPDAMSNEQFSQLNRALNHALNESQGQFSAFDEGTLERIYRHVQAVPGLKKLHSVERTFPDGFSIAAEWRQPFIQVQDSNDKLVIVDDEGVVLPGSYNFASNDLVIRGDFSPRGAYGERWADDSLIDAIHLAKFLGERKGLAFEVKTIQVSKGQRRGTTGSAFYRLYTTTGLEIRWGAYVHSDNPLDPHSRERILSNVQRIMGRHKDTLARIQSIDPRFEGAADVIVYKTR